MDIGPATVVDAERNIILFGSDRRNIFGLVFPVLVVAGALIKCAIAWG